MNKRLKEIRTSLNLTQEQFAEQIGITRSSIAKLESGDRKISDQLAKAICNQYRVNYFWFRDEAGEMFESLPESILDELVEDYGLDELDKVIIQKYVELDERERAVFKKYLKSILVTK